MTQPSNEPPGEPKREPDKNRVITIICVWALIAWLAGLVCLSTLEPFIGLPLMHPINLALLALFGAIGLVFTVGIWFERPRK